MRWANAYARELARLAPDHGFGFVDRKLRARNARQAAAYLSRYFVSGAGKAPITEAVTNPEMPSRPLWCSPRLTRRSRVTMRNLRRCRHFYAHRAWPDEVPAPSWLLDESKFAVAACVAYLTSHLRVPPPPARLELLASRG
jgi:hypothetical protein